MSSRSWHPKSRNGCGQCKKRRIKCDFRAPICANCKRREQKCDYQHLQVHETNIQHPSQSAAAQSGLGLVPRISNVPRAFGNNQIRPAILISLDDDQARVWDLAVAREVAKHGFLQQAFLVMSSLYHEREALSSNRQDLAAAFALHIEASSLFRKSALASTGQDWAAHIMFSMTVLVFQFRVAAQPDDDCMAETIRVLRSSAQFALSIAPSFLHSQAVTRQSTDHDISPDPQMLCAMDNLEQFVDALSSKGSPESIYQQPVQALKQWVGATKGRPRLWLHFLWWPVSVGQEYINLLSQKQPVALLIFLHWCAVMANAPRRWFLDGWADNLAKQAFRCLGPQWEPFLSWPNSVFGFENSQIVVRCLEERRVSLIRARNVPQ